MDEVLREESLAYEVRLTRWRKIADPRTDIEEFLVLIFVNPLVRGSSVPGERNEEQRSEARSNRPSRTSTSKCTS